ncbi:hypothetical protein [Streptomyces otsuchiensis]|uniref:hypothetical protein n=1 Tax=Streptomyces otsuchiensis TaxID=2681388 RepID=UPI00102F4078|nr:hypothetical protein [Streptomyces otsuchiensis]
MTAETPAAGETRHHAQGCVCEACPHGARHRHRRAATAFARRRDELAAGVGVPDSLARSPEAARQWISDELTIAARELAALGRTAGAARLATAARRTVIAAWTVVGVLVALAQLLAPGGGWSLSTTAGLLAGVAVAAVLTLAWRVFRPATMFAPLVGDDGRFCTARAVAAAWLLLSGYAALLLSATLAGAAGPQARRELAEGLTLANGAGLLVSVGIALAAAGWVRLTVSRRVRRFAMQKVRADRPRPADLVGDDDGVVGFAPVAYLVASAAALSFAAAGLIRTPSELPPVPWPLVALFALAAAAHVAGAYTDGARPVILSVVRAREPGGPHAPVRPGDDIEIRGSGFVPPGARRPARLAETVVRVGNVYAPVPLIPVEGGFSNPSEDRLVVALPAEVEPGRTEIRVITAAGTESGRYTITVAD